MATLELGAQIPSWHWDWDVSELRDWAQGVEAIGFDYLSMADHVAYAYGTPDRPTEAVLQGPIVQHELFTFLAYLAACTNRVVLQPNVLVLPQRQPLLVAKQAAEVDLLSGGRLRLGVGLGWQEPEFDALGVPFRQRPSRTEEAVALIRACWREEPVTYAGRYATIQAMSVLPKPATPGGPPILFGGRSAPAIERAARIGDGWIGQQSFSPAEAAQQVAALRELLAAANRDPAAFPIQWMTPLAAPDELRRTLEAYRDAGASRLGVMMPTYEAAGQISVDEYLLKLEGVWREVWPAVRA